MDYIIFNQPGGFPLQTDTLESMQKMYRPFINGLGGMAGERAIICGCEQIGDKITGGIIQIDGEMYALIEGIKQEYITIREDRENYEFENGENKATVIYRYAIFGSGTNSYRWEEFKRVIPLNTIQERINEKENITRVSELENRIQMLEYLSSPDSLGGTIKIWCRPANQIPKGWASADEFIDKMLRGGWNVGQEGGSDTHTITVKQMPSHSHSYNKLRVPGSSGGRGREGHYVSPGEISADTSSVGGNEPIPTLPKHRIVLFIKWVGF